MTLLAAYKVYPIRVRFPNVVTGKVQWLTIGYLAVIEAVSDDAAEVARMRLLRVRVLQRCIAVLLHDFFVASEHGVVMDVPRFGPMLAVPRITLYAADQPEERHLLGLMLSGCGHPCSHCMVSGSSAGCEDADTPRRHVIDMLDLHLEAATLHERGICAGRIEQIRALTSVLPIVPALGAEYGLGTGSCALYDIFGFDLLHVLFR